ncbi:hypothetical protein Pmani_031958 [Petrolisthes manimaculis]|uniref:Uncharacterized protein n=1 Tax=Petrolisthes manimaculis TaxID=1843537 RepID=A0AAE1TU99_9EUCA|nr:hypothetical protein Pmani_031958 [Petrolisthes manimaculis]
MFTSSTGVGVGVGVVVFMLLSSSTTYAFSFSQPLAAADGGMGRQTKQFPCPEDADIDPCTCLYLDNSLSLTCSNTDGETLKNIFANAVFPFSDFGSLRIENCEIGILEDGMFNGLTFQSVQFINNNIVEVEPDALSTSATTLISFTMSARIDEAGPLTWPLPNFSAYTALEAFSLDGPYDPMPPLGATPITTFSLHSTLSPL